MTSAGQTHTDTILTHYSADFSTVLGTIDTGAVYGGLLTALVITGARRYFLQA